MYITREKFEEICKKHNIFPPLEEGAEDALNFTQELLEAEIKAVKAVEPSAITTIDRLKRAAQEVSDLCGEIMDEGFW